VLVPLLGLAVIGAPGPKPGAPPAQTLDELLRPVLERAYGLALRLLRNPADAEDLVQEAALAACRGFGTFQQGTNFKAWFFRILTNCFYARRRRRNAGVETLELDEVPELYLHDRTAEIGLHQRAPDPAQALLSRLDTEQIAAALERLPEEYRVVATLYFIDDFSYDEIAGILGIPVGTVRSRLHRGRKQLQTHLWNVAVEHGVIAEPNAGGRP
jgi:RNA polymerase sigma-70 factor (ECF subfamily)